VTDLPPDSAEVRVIEPRRGGPGRLVEGVYTHPAGERRYALYLPEGWDPAQRYALVVMLHGCTQDAADFARGTRMNALADERHLVVLYPQQSSDANPLRCWNWFVPAHQHRGAGEPAILADLVRATVEQYAIDGDRVFLAGVSAGAAMAATVAAAYPERFAALALHSGVPALAATTQPEALQLMHGGGGDPAALARALLAEMGARRRPLPVIVFQGAQDRVVHPDNARATAEQWFRAGVNDPVAAAVPAAESPIVSRYRTPAGRTLVELWLVPGVGHAWSGGSPEGTYTAPDGPDASRELLRFFADQTSLGPRRP
jgi:poly(hydroxyalkanoate) depolymerase family esterase